jgi:hypothetical protein
MFKILYLNENKLHWQFQLTNNITEEQKTFVTQNDCNRYLTDSLFCLLHNKIHFITNVMAKNSPHNNFGPVGFEAFVRISKLYKWMCSGNTLPVATDVAKYIIISKQHFKTVAALHSMNMHIETINCIIDAAEQIRKIN